MTDVAGLYERAIDEFDRRVAQVGDDQWHASTPCTEWDVRDLVNHLVNENMWAVPLLEGKTIAEVGSAFDGDLLGDDPKAVWSRSAREGLRAAQAEGAMERTVHLSFGDASGADYISQVLADHVIHSWDLARGIGADERLDPDLVDFVLETLGPQAEDWRNAGVFGGEVDAGPEADPQTKLLALTGRRP